MNRLKVEVIVIRLTESDYGGRDGTGKIQGSSVFIFQHV